MKTLPKQKVNIYWKMLTSKIVTVGPIVVYGTFTGGLSTCNRGFTRKMFFQSLYQSTPKTKTGQVLPKNGHDKDAETKDSQRGSTT